ncbi:hypothetical protein F5Y05DRAFT_371563 [Hypoxylon sp. FL0543]|nr:hypothetical protein F5Y05DRAFT_371563 [Hypoxylon sp. FL0543]
MSDMNNQSIMGDFDIRQWLNLPADENVENVEKDANEQPTASDGQDLLTEQQMAYLDEFNGLFDIGENNWSRFDTAAPTEAPEEQYLPSSSDQNQLVAQSGYSLTNDTQQTGYSTGQPRSAGHLADQAPSQPERGMSGKAGSYMGNQPNPYPAQPAVYVGEQAQSQQEQRLPGQAGSYMGNQSGTHPAKEAQYQQEPLPAPRNTPRPIAPALPSKAAAPESQPRRRPSVKATKPTKPTRQQVIQEASTIMEQATPQLPNFVPKDRYINGESCSVVPNCS